MLERLANLTMLNVTTVGKWVISPESVVLKQQQSHNNSQMSQQWCPSKLQLDIPPMFHILHLTQMQKRLRLKVDSASPITFINVKAWQDLEKPNLQSTD